MIVDSSVLVAVLLGEPDAAGWLEAMAAADSLSVAAPTALESAIVLGPRRHSALDALLDAAAVEVVAFDAEHARVARDAYARYGKGSDSPARLNLGDCFSYALAQVSGEPLLCKDDAFNHTDVTVARPAS